MTKYLYMINWALTCIDKLLKVISERNYLQNYVSRMFYNSCNISILYQTLHRLKDGFFFLAFITQKLLHQKSYVPKFLQYWALQYNSIIFLLISFCLSLLCFSPSLVSSLFSLTSLLSHHLTQVSPSLSLFFSSLLTGSLSFFSPMDHGGGGSWIVAEICSDLMDVVGLIWWIVAKIRFDFFSGISGGG